MTDQALDRSHVKVYEALIDAQGSCQIFKLPIMPRGIKKAVERLQQTSPHPTYTLTLSRRRPEKVKRGVFLMRLSYYIESQIMSKQMGTTKL